MKSKSNRKKRSQPRPKPEPLGWQGYEARKRSHLVHSLSPDNQAFLSRSKEFADFQATHQPLGDLNFEDVTLGVNDFAGSRLRAPFYVSSMTAGVKDAVRINDRLAKACENKGWIFALGSLRRELESGDDAFKIAKLRRAHPGLVILGNLGAAQLVALGAKKILEGLRPFGLQGMCIHLNPLQEALQTEGTPHFKGFLNELQKFIEISEIPIILKETGCGFSIKSLQILSSIKGLYALDLAGLGGTHWGRIEGARAKDARDDVRARASVTFKDWGVPLEASLIAAMKHTTQVKELWASGGVRDGLYAQFLRHLGASRVGFAQPALLAAQTSTQTVEKFMEQIEFEARLAMFCRGEAL